MSKNSIQQFSTLASSNTDIVGINVNTGWPPNNVGPAFRTLMALLADSLKPLIIDVTGLGSITLSAAQASAEWIEFQGAITAPLTVTLPNAFFVGHAANESAGGHPVILTSGGGTNVTLPDDGYSYTYRCDGGGNTTLPGIGFGAINLSGPIAVLGDLVVSGTLTVDDGVTITGNSAVNGQLTVTGGGTSEGRWTITSGGVTVDSGGASITGTMTVVGNTGLNGTLLVTDGGTSLGSWTITAGGLFVSSGGASITGDSSVNGTVALSAASSGGQAARWNQALGGANATYQGFLGSKFLDTTYTNSTGRPIFVSVWGVGSGVDTFVAQTPDGNQVALSGLPMAGQTFGITFVVPTGATYKVTTFHGSITLQGWQEL